MSKETLSIQLSRAFSAAFSCHEKSETDPGFALTSARGTISGLIPAGVEGVFHDARLSFEVTKCPEVVVLVNAWDVILKGSDYKCDRFQVHTKREVYEFQRRGENNWVPYLCPVHPDDWALVKKEILRRYPGSTVGASR